MMPPGFRFSPTEEELILFYLKHKIEPGPNRWKQSIHRAIPELQVYDFHPWDLPQYAGECCQRDSEPWFFFIPRQEKEARGGRQSRLTSSGYWKATGSLGVVYSSSNRAIGIKRSMVFYNGRAPKGTKTKWKMIEYNAFQDQSTSTNSKPAVMKEISLCRIYVTSNSLRAFDRRPSRVMMINEQLPVPRPLQNNEHEATTSTRPSVPSIPTGLSNHSSHDSSDDQNVNHHPHSMMESDDNPLWDWDELDKWL